MQPYLRHTTITHIRPFRHLPMPINRHTPHQRIRILRNGTIKRRNQPPIIRLCIKKGLRVKSIRPTGPLTMRRRTISILNSQRPRFQRIRFNGPVQQNRRLTNRLHTTRVRSKRLRTDRIKTGSRRALTIPHIQDLRISSFSIPIPHVIRRPYRASNLQRIRVHRIRPARNPRVLRRSTRILQYLKAQRRTSFLGPIAITCIHPFQVINGHTKFKTSITPIRNGHMNGDTSAMIRLPTIPLNCRAIIAVVISRPSKGDTPLYLHILRRRTPHPMNLARVRSASVTVAKARALRTHSTCYQIKRRHLIRRYLIRHHTNRVHLPRISTSRINSNRVNSNGIRTLRIHTFRSNIS